MRREQDIVWTVSTAHVAGAALLSLVVELGVSRGSFVVCSNSVFFTISLALPILSDFYLRQVHPVVVETMYVSVLLGASSMAFHAHPTLGSPGHTMDIVAAWLLYIQLAFASAYAVCRRFCHHRRLLLWWSAAKACVILVVIANYSSVKPRQVELLVGCGAVTHACMLANQVLAPRGAGVSKWRALAHALLDTTCLGAVQLAAAFLNGGIWGVRPTPEQYNIEHGFWHLLNGQIVSVVMLHLMQSLDERNLRRRGGAECIVQAATTTSALWLVSLSQSHTDNDTLDLFAFFGPQALLFVASMVFTCYLDVDLHVRQPGIDVM